PRIGQPGRLRRICQQERHAGREAQAEGRGDSPVPNEGRPEGDGFGIGTRDRRLHPGPRIDSRPAPEAYFRAHVSIASRLSTETPKTIADSRRFYRACTAIGRVSVP